MRSCSSVWLSSEYILHTLLRYLKNKTAWALTPHLHHYEQCRTLGMVTNEQYSKFNMWRNSMLRATRPINLGYPDPATSKKDATKSRTGWALGILSSNCAWALSAKAGTVPDRHWSATCAIAPNASRKQCFFFGFAFTLSTKSSLVHPRQPARHQLAPFPQITALRRALEFGVVQENEFNHVSQQAGKCLVVLQQGWHLASSAALGPESMLH